MTDQESYGELPYGTAEELDDVEPARRPGAVTTASVLTWVFAGLALFGCGWMLVAVNADRAAFEREVARQNDLDALGVSAQDLASTFTLVGSGLAVLSVLAIVLAVGVHRGSNVARLLLITLSLVTCVICLMLSFALVPLLWLVAALTAAVLLMTGRTKGWTQRRR